MKPNENFDEQNDNQTPAVQQTAGVAVITLSEIGSERHIESAKQAILKCQGQVMAIIDKYKEFKKPEVGSPDFKLRIKEIDADRKSLKAFRTTAINDHEQCKKPALVYCQEVDKVLREYKSVIEPNESKLQNLHAELEADLKNAENEKRNTRIKALVEAGYELSEGNYVLLDRTLAYSELLKASDATIKSLVDFGADIVKARKAKQDELDKEREELDAQRKALAAREAAVLAREIELGLIVKPSEGIVEPLQQEPVPNPEYKEPKEIVASVNIPEAQRVIETGAEVKVFGVDVESFNKGFEQFRTAMMIAIEEDRFQSEADLMNFVVTVQPEIKLAITD